MEIGLHVHVWRLSLPPNIKYDMSSAYIHEWLKDSF